MTVNVLICDDDPEIAELVSLAAGVIWPTCHTQKAADGNEALSLFFRTTPDLVMLDLSMPELDGFEVCRRIREVSKVPIIVLTAHNSTMDKVKAFKMGADDYVIKPFDTLELLARMRALVRRKSDQEQVDTGTTEIVIGDLCLNTARREVRVRDQLVHLTSTEYKLLEEMARHPGVVLSHSTLMRRVWGNEYEDEGRYLKVFVRRLRKKLGDDTKVPRYIQTEWGVGYRMAASA